MADPCRVVIVADIVLDVVVQIRRAGAARRHVHRHIIAFEVVVDYIVQIIVQIEIDVPRAGRVASSRFASSGLTATEIALRFAACRSNRVAFTDCRPIFTRARTATSSSPSAWTTFRGGLVAFAFATNRRQIGRPLDRTARGDAPRNGATVVAGIASSAPRPSASPAASTAAPGAFAARINIARVDVAGINIPRVDVSGIGYPRCPPRLVLITFEHARVNITRINIPSVNFQRLNIGTGRLWTFFDNAAASATTTAAAAAARVALFVVVTIGFARAFPCIPGGAVIRIIVLVRRSDLAFSTGRRFTEPAKPAENVVFRVIQIGLCLAALFASGFILPSRFVLASRRIAARSLMRRKLFQKSSRRRRALVRGIGRQTKRSRQVRPIGRRFSGSLRRLRRSR